MKIAISGKGGSGKTTISACLSKVYLEKGKRVILIDADPDSNLKSTLNIKEEITPLIELKEIIAERTGTKPGERAIIFKMNPEVDDIPEKFFYKNGNLLLGIMGTVKGGGLGCMCPENAFLKAVLRNLILKRNEVVILDMPAGIEHLGRGTTEGIDWLFIITEATEKSIETTKRIEKLAKDINIKNIGVIGNKIESDKEKEFLKEKLSDMKILTFIPYFNEFKKSELEGQTPWEAVPEILNYIEEILNKMEGKDGR
ncbi:MAG: AAA family ATPase [Candidatus Omnitrophica bacterium]|nr:AAA family ATPase [Candidatus Omnitrophota bacterium]MCM8803512.1 AAA family ATPase [Candidatus Omnitrophota bacterium]